MGKMASALIKIIDCVKRRLLHERDCEEKATCLRHELDKRRDGPVTDPCWTWVQGYISSHQDDMTEWGIQWLEDGAERSKYGGRSYDEVLQDIHQFEMDCKNEKDDCNQPAKGQEPPRGLRIAVATRIAAGQGKRHASLAQRESRHARLSIPFRPNPPPPPCGPGTPDLFTRRQDSCAYVPQMVFLNATPDIKHTPISVRCSDVMIGRVGQYAVSVTFKSEYTTSLFLDPKWLPQPQGINVMPSSYKLNTIIAPKARLRLECSDGQILLAEAVGQAIDANRINWSRDFSFTVELPSPGEYTLRSVLMASWAGRFSVEFNKQSIIDGVFERTSVIDPLGHSEGDGSCNIGMFRVVDLRDLSETIRASTPVSGSGTDSDPYSAEPNFVAKSPYTFPFSTPQGSFELQEQLLRKESKTALQSWPIIRDCARRRVNKVRIYISPPHYISNATFFLPNVYLKDYAYIDAVATPLPQLSKIKINGIALDGDNVIAEGAALKIKNDNLVPFPIQVIFSGQSYFIYPGYENNIYVNKCDAYKGTTFAVTFRHQEGFCEINGDTEKTANIYHVDNSWKIFPQRARCVSLTYGISVVKDGTRCIYYLIGYDVYALFALESYEPECFDYEIVVDANVSVYGGVMASSIATSVSREGDVLKSENMTLGCDDPLVSKCYSNINNNTLSGTYKITKTNKLNGNSVIATYQIAEQDIRYPSILYGNLLSIEEVP